MVGRKDKNKIILIILVFMLIISNTVLIYISIKQNTIKSYNKEIRNEITKIQNNILTIENENNKTSKELDNKKIELNGKMKEYNIWLKMKEKIK